MLDLKLYLHKIIKINAIQPETVMIVKDKKGNDNCIPINSIVDCLDKLPTYQQELVYIAFGKREQDRDKVLKLLYYLAKPMACKRL